MTGVPLEITFRSRPDGSAAILTNSLAEMEARALRDSAYRKDFLQFIGSVQQMLNAIQHRVESPPPSTADLDARDHRLNSAKGRTATERLSRRLRTRPRLVWKSDESE